MPSSTLPDFSSNDNSSTSSTSTKSSAEPAHNSDNISNAPSTHTSNARHKCTIVYSGHIISAIDIVLHYIVNQGRKTSREMNGSKISEQVLTAQQVRVETDYLQGVFMNNFCFDWILYSWFLLLIFLIYSFEMKHFKQFERFNKINNLSHF